MAYPDDIQGDPGVDQFWQILAARRAQQQAAQQQPEIVSPEWAGPRPGTPPPETTSPNAILKILELFTRLDKAPWTGVNYLKQGRPEGFLGGFWEGLTGGENAVEAADVLGLPEAQDTDTWGDYLAKGGTRLAANVFLSPTTYWGAGIPKIAGALGIKGAAEGARGLRSLKIADDLAEKIAGTEFGRALFQRAPLHQEGFNVSRLGAEYGGNTTRQFVLSEAERVSKELMDAGFGIEDLPAIRLAIEEPQKAAELLGDRTGDVLRIMQPLRSKASELFNQRNAILSGLDLPTREAITESSTHGFVPRPLTEEGRWMLSRRGQPGSVLLDASQPQSRELMRFVSADELAKGNLVDPLGEPIVTKLEDRFLKANNIVEKDGQYFLKGQGPVPEDLIRVQPVQSSLDAITRSKVLPAGTFLENPTAAFGADIIKKQGQVNFLNFVKDSLDEGKYLVDTAKETIPEGWRNLRIRGMEDFAAPKWAANQIENMSAIMLDPESSFGWFEAGMKAIENSPIGQALKKYTQVWSRNQLALHPGFHVANVISNQVLAFLGDIKNPYRMIEAGNIQLGKGAEVISGITNAELRNRFVEAGLISPETIADVFNPIAKEGEKRWSKYLTDKMPGSTGEGAQKLIDRAQQLNNFGFQVSAAIESNNRVAMAIDYLKKAMGEGARFDEDTFAKAVLHAKEYGLSYDQLDPITRRLKMYMPFVAWTRQMTGRFLKDMGAQPGKLGNLERFTETLFQPMSQSDLEVMPEYLKTQGPVGGVLGHQFDTESGAPGVLLTSRFNPFGSIEDMTQRPLNFLGGQMAPWIKAPYKIVSGRDIFSNQDIDPVAGTGVASLVNPLGMGDYGLASRRFLGMDVPAMPRSLLSETPISRYATAADTLGAGTLWEDQSRPEMSAAEKAMWYTTGGKTYPFDYAKAYASKNAAWKREVQTLRSKMTQAYTTGNGEAGDHYRNQLINKMQRGPLGQSMVEGS